MYRHHLDKLVRTRLDDIVVAEGLLDRARLEAAQAEQDQSGNLLSDVLLDAETIDEWDLAKLVATHYTLPFVDIRLCSIPTNVLDLLPLEWCRKHSLLPFDQFGKTIGVACVEVPPTEVVEEITQRTGCMPFIYVGLRRGIRDVIDENLKRRGRAPVSTTPAARSVVAAPPAAAAPAVASPPPVVPVPSPAAAPAPPPAPKSKPTIPAALPRVSLKLNATAGGLAHGALHARPGAKPLLDRFPNPAGATLPAAKPAAPRNRSSVTGAAAAAKAAPVVTDGKVQKLSPIQHLLQQPDLAAPVPPMAPAPPARAEDPPRPKLASRTAPVLPAANQARVASTTPAPASPAVPAPGPAAATRPAGWESIFDSGDNAVRSRPK